MRSRTTALPTLFMSQFACTMDKQAARATRIVVRKPAVWPSTSRSYPMAAAESSVRTTRRPTSPHVKVKGLSRPDLDTLVFRT